jgi:hypothetical protein
MFMEKVIRLYFCDPCIITADEYKQIKKDVESRYLANCSEVGDRVLAHLLVEHYGRYHEVK